MFPWQQCTSMLRISWPWACIAVSWLQRYRSQLWHCCTPPSLSRWKMGVQQEEQLDAVLGIQDVSAVRKTQEGRSWEGENLTISAQVKLCLSQSHPAAAQDFPTFAVKSSWPESCFPMFHSISHSVDVHLSLSYCFEQLQYLLLLSPKPLQTSSQICRGLHMV